MATPIIMPRQGQSVESCIISNWAKKVGDKVAEGDTLFTYETDKATFDEEAKISGTLLAIFFNEGDDVPCLTNVCVIGQPGESFAEFDPNGAAKAAASAQEAPKAEHADIDLRGNKEENHEIDSRVQKDRQHPVVSANTIILSCPLRTYMSPFVFIHHNVIQSEYDRIDAWTFYERSDQSICFCKPIVTKFKYIRIK